jgi:hypothetical protein
MAGSSGIQKMVDGWEDKLWRANAENARLQERVDALTVERDLALASSQANRLGLCPKHDATIRCDMPCPLCELAKAEALAERRKAALETIRPKLGLHTCGSNPPSATFGGAPECYLCLTDAAIEEGT